MNTRQEPPVNNLNYPNPVKLAQENAKLKTRIKQLELEKNTSNAVLFPSYNRNMRTVDGQPICNRRKKVSHTERVCRQNSYNQQHNTNSYNSYILSLVGEVVQTIKTYTQDTTAIPSKSIRSTGAAQLPSKTY